MSTDAKTYARQEFVMSTTNRTIRMCARPTARICQIVGLPALIAVGSCGEPDSPYGECEVRPKLLEPLEVEVVDLGHQADLHACLGLVCAGDAGRVVQMVDGNAVPQQLSAAIDVRGLWPVFVEPPDAIDRTLIAEPTGAVWFSDDDLQTWAAADVPGIVEFIALGAELNAVPRLLFARDAVWESSDFGESWQARDTQDPPPYEALAYWSSDGLFAVGASGSMWRSHDDGRTWETVDTPFEEDLRAVAASDFVFVGGSSGRMASYDPTNDDWETWELEGGPTIHAISVQRGGAWEAVWAVGSEGAIFHRFGRYDWERVDADLTSDLLALGVETFGDQNVHFPEQILAVGRDGAAIQIHAELADYSPCGGLD